MGMLAFLDATTPYAYIITAFVIMGFGMGATMMPVFTAALASLKDHDIARGSTLMNITQQVSASVGTALFSVLLTNAYNQHADVVNATLKIQSGATERPTTSGPDPRSLGLHYMGLAFGDVFVVATVLVGLCLIPAFFLPRRPAEKPADAAAMMVG